MLQLMEMCLVLFLHAPRELDRPNVRGEQDCDLSYLLLCEVSELELVGLVVEVRCRAGRAIYMRRCGLTVVVVVGVLIGGLFVSHKGAIDNMTSQEG